MSIWECDEQQKAQLTICMPGVPVMQGWVTATHQETLFVTVNLLLLHFIQIRIYHSSN
jgi:hypothetical protein